MGIAPYPERTGTRRAPTVSFRIGMRNRTVLGLSFLFTMAVTGPALMATPPRELVAAESQQGKKKSKAGSERDSLTGCVDQQDGRYLLLDLKSRDPIANLE